MRDLPGTVGHDGLVGGRPGRPLAADSVSGSVTAGGPAGLSVPV